jgi:exopolysaccharide biosynthesis polyprenyl glycosylphosphotransferase
VTKSETRTASCGLRRIAAPFPLPEAATRNHQADPVERSVLRDDSSHSDTPFLVTDLLVGAAAFLTALSLPGMLSSEQSSLRLVGFGFGSALVWPLAFEYFDVYAIHRRRGLRELHRQILLIGGATIGLHALAGLVVELPTATVFPAFCAALQLAAFFCIHWLIYSLSRWVRRSDRFDRNVVIVGTGPRAEYVQQAIGQNPDWALHIIGFIDDFGPHAQSSIPHERIFKLNDMAGLLQDQVIDEVIVAVPRSMLASIIPVVDACAAAGVPITVLSDLFGDYLPAPKVSRFGTLPALSFAPVHHNRIALAIKRGIDIMGALVGILISAPAIAVSAGLIKFTSPGPVFFRQVRCGLNGRHFVMLKLRTMSADAEDRRLELDDHNEMDGPVFKMTRDPRITPVGRRLRQFSIDELPQFWNVLRGDMSLVGPRPPVPVEVAEYQTFERRRLSMRPGLTCLWQVSGRNSIGFDDWVRLDLEYIDTWSLSSDIKILLNTLPAVLSGEGAS